ncbi:MAG: hypothetical protein K2J39_06035, partial [Ruminococcus sp.]|nr:hypothetical protein [Ruminococcus sp.]
ICSDYKNKIIFKINVQYQKEKLEYYEKMKDSEINKDMYIHFDDETYKNIFQKTVERMNMLDYEVANLMNIEASNFSKYKNLTKKNGKYYKPALKHLRYKDNVITIAKDLGLSLKDFCYFIWSRGHEFPTNDDDYDIIEKLLEKEMEIEENILYYKFDKDL